MSYQFDFDSTNGILRCQVDGRLTDEGMKECYRVAAEYVTKIGPCAGIMDFSAVTSFEVSPQTMRELAAAVPIVPDPRRVRVLVAPSDLIFGMLRLFQFEGEHTRPNLHVVRTLSEAWAVLGVQDPQFDRLETT